MPDQDKLRVGSVCSGVGGFELGLHRADPRFDVRWMCEFLKPRQAVLRRHWPDVPIHPDLKELDPDALEPIDILVGGTPCQGLSVAGKGRGLEDDRSSLFWHFIRLRNSLLPRWTVWENVPGAFSQNGGMDFALVLGAFVGAEIAVPAGGWSRAGVAAGPWGGAVWRTLNSQHFGVPQRRHRLFIVGCLGGPVPPEVLLERARGGGNPAPGEETRPGAAGDAGEEPRGAGGVVDSITGRYGRTGADENDARSGRLVSTDEPDVAPSLTQRYYKGLRSPEDAVVVEPAEEVAATLTSCGNAKSTPNRRQEDDINLVSEEPIGFPANAANREAEEQGIAPPVRGGAKHGTPAVAFEARYARNGRGAPSEVVPPLKAESGSTGKGDGAPLAFVENQRDELREVEQAPALQSQSGTHQDTRLLEGPQVRRLTPTECERLQGFPDGWTIPEGESLVDALSHYQLEARPGWEGAAFTKRHAANHDQDYESWEEAKAARTLVDGRLNGTLAVSVRTSQTGANGIGVGEEIAPAVDSTGGAAVAHALTGEGHDASEDGTGRGTPLVADVAPTLRTQQRNNSNAVTEASMLVTDGAVPEDVPFDPLPDAHRYAAMGDAVTVPVISFIGSRIAALEEGRNPDG